MKLQSLNFYLFLKCFSHSAMIEAIWFYQQHTKKKVFFVEVPIPPLMLESVKNQFSSIFYTEKGSINVNCYS